MAKFIIGLLVWGACLFGILQIERLSSTGWFTHSICGPWGCGPPVPVLVAWHGFWLVLLIPMVGLLTPLLSDNKLRVLGLLLVSVGILALAGVFFFEVRTWLPSIPEGQPAYFVRRYMFAVATLVDMPIIPVTLAGVLAWAAGSFRSQQKHLRRRSDVLFAPRFDDDRTRYNNVALTEEEEYDAHRSTETGGTLLR